MGATISIYLDTRVKKTDDLYPLKLRVTFDRKRMYLGIPKNIVNDKLEKSFLSKYRFNGPGNFSMSEVLFNKTMEAQRGELKDLQTVFKIIEVDAQMKADSMEQFSLEGFKKLMTTSKSKTNKVFLIFDEIISELEAEERIGTAKSYSNSRTSLKEFVGVRDVTFEYFTLDRLKKYYKWMKDEGKTDSTIGIYLRPLRAVFNIAISRGITSHYPFNRSYEKGQFMIPKGSGRKIALDRSELKKIFEYHLPADHPYSFYFDAFKLMFYLGGINPTDLCLLKPSNIKDGFVFYSRQKTIRTSHEKKIIQTPYTEAVAELIEKWKPADKNSFLLPVLDNSMSAATRKMKTDQFAKMVNTAMNAIAKDLGITKHITTYVARHSIATQLLQAGASVKFIGDQLGHNSAATTEKYLEGFTDDQIKEAYEKVTKF